MKKNLLIGLGVVTSLTIGVVVIYAQISNNPSVPPVEVNARFSSADKNGDGVLSKEEFASYLVKMKQIKSVAQETGKTCPETGLPCEHDDASASDCCNDNAKTVAKTADGEKSCCSEGKNAETVSVKFSSESEAKKGGCCGDKDNAQNTETVPVKFSNEGEVKKASGEKGCCGDKNKAKTTDAKKADGEKGCCGDKDKAKTTDAKKADGEKGCCSEGKTAETVSVKFSNEGEAKKASGEKGCCGDKDKAKTTDTKNADGEKGCCGDKDKAKTANTKRADGEKGCCGDKSKEAQKKTNSADELAVTDSGNQVTVEKTEAETKTPEVSETNSNDKQ
jgi:hypothetical protein